LCVTHTRNAADEMRSRIGRHENTRTIQVSTIHSLCYRILKTRLGQPIRILSDYDHGVIVRLAAQAAGIDSDHREIATVISQAKLGLIERREEIRKLLRESARLKGETLDSHDHFH